MSKARDEKRRYTSARERADKHETSGFVDTYLKLPKGAVFFKPKAGVSLLDIIPYVTKEGNPWADEGSVHWERTYWAHRGIGANQDTYLCPRKHKVGRCPICEHRLVLMKKDEDDNEDLVKKLAPSERQLFNVINLKEPEKGIQLLDISYHCFGKLVDERLRTADGDDDEDTERWQQFFHLEDGMTLKVCFGEESFGGFKFLKASTVDFRERKEQYDDDTLDDAFCLDDILVVPSYEKLKKVFLETEADDEDDEDDDEPRSTKARSRRDEDDDDDEDEKPAKGKSRDDDDEDEDDDEPPKKKVAAEEDADEDDEPPRRKKVRDEEDADDEPPKKKKKVPADADDWDDFDEDDDEPVKKKVKAEADDDEDEDDDEPPKNKTKASDNGEADADDDEDDEPPKKKKVHAGKRDEDEDEDGWDDEDYDKRSKEHASKQKVKAKAKDDDEDDD